MNRKLSLRLSHFCCDLLDESDDLFDLLMSEHDAVQNNFLRNFVGSGFYHHNRILRTGYLEIDIAGGSLRLCRVDDEFTVHPSYRNGTCRTVPRNI